MIYINFCEQYGISFKFSNDQNMNEKIKIECITDSTKHQCIKHTKHNLFYCFNFYCDLSHHKSASIYDLERDKTKFNAHSIQQSWKIINYGTIFLIISQPLSCLKGFNQFLFIDAGALNSIPKRMLSNFSLLITEYFPYLMFISLFMKTFTFWIIKMNFIT